MPAPESKSSQPNIQDVFLNYVRREKLVVVIRMMDASELEGRIKNFLAFRPDTHDVWLVDNRRWEEENRRWRARLDRKSVV